MGGPLWDDWGVVGLVSVVGGGVCGLKDGGPRFCNDKRAPSPARLPRREGRPCARAPPGTPSTLTGRPFQWPGRAPYPLHATRLPPNPSPAVTPEDRKFMNLALDQAMRAWGQTHPNPHVGCVIVKDGQVRPGGGVDTPAQHTSPCVCDHRLCARRPLPCSACLARGCCDTLVKAHILLAPCATSHTSHPRPRLHPQVVGEGYHPKAGQPHAEVFALRGAGEGPPEGGGQRGGSQGEAAARARTCAAPPSPALAG